MSFKGQNYTGIIHVVANKHMNINQKQIKIKKIPSSKIQKQHEVQKFPPGS